MIFYNPPGRFSPNIVTAIGLGTAIGDRHHTYNLQIHPITAGILGKQFLPRDAL